MEVGEDVANERIHEPWMQIGVGPDEVTEIKRVIVERQHELAEAVERVAQVARVLVKRRGRDVASLEALIEDLRTLTKNEARLDAPKPTSTTTPGRRPFSARPLTCLASRSECSQYVTPAR